MTSPLAPQITSAVFGPRGSANQPRSGRGLPLDDDGDRRGRCRIRPPGSGSFEVVPRARHIGEVPLGYGRLIDSAGRDPRAVRRPTSGPAGGPSPRRPRTRASPQVTVGSSSPRSTIGEPSARPTTRRVPFSTNATRSPAGESPRVEGGGVGGDAPHLAIVDRADVGPSVEGEDDEPASGVGGERGDSAACSPPSFAEARARPPTQFPIQDRAR